MANQAALKRKWQWPWARRQNPWDPPTLLDQLLDSPLRTIVHHLYLLFLYLRGAPFVPPRNKPPIRVVCISDTHTNTTDVPSGDLLIHCGDLVNDGSIREIQAQLDWLDALPHKEKIVIAGNHDGYFDPKSRRPEDNGKRLNFKSLHYLEKKSITLKFKGGRRLNIYGSPYIPECGGADFAFQYPRGIDVWKDQIPRDTDVLVTHTPPRYHLDLGIGCASLLEEIWRVKPRLHVFGHVHSGHGQQPVFWDEGQRAYERLMASKKGGVIADFFPGWAWIDALHVIWYGVKGVFWQWLMVGPAGGNGGVLVNAALVYQSTTTLGNRPEVVDL